MTLDVDRYQAASGTFDAPDAEPPVPDGYIVSGPWEPVTAWEAERVEPGPAADLAFILGTPLGGRAEMTTRVLWRRPLALKGRPVRDWPPNVDLPTGKAS